MNNKKSREVLFTICLGLITIHIILRIDILVYFLLGLIFIGAFSSYLSYKIAWLWMELGKALGFISSRLLLSIVFFLFLTPIALLHRLSKGGRTKSERKSNFIFRNHNFSENDFLRPF